MDAKTFYKIAKEEAEVYNAFGVTVQAVLETGHFTSKLSVAYNNFGGVKKKDGDGWEGKVIGFPSIECIKQEDGTVLKKMVVSQFRWYDSAEHYLKELNKKLSEPRYEVCRKGVSCFWLHFAGLYLGKWATDPEYFRKLTELAISQGANLLGKEWKDHEFRAFQFAKGTGHLEKWMERTIKSKLEGVSE